MRALTRARQKASRARVRKIRTTPRLIGAQPQQKKTKNLNPLKNGEWQRKLPFLFLSIIYYREFSLLYIYYLCADSAPPRCRFCTGSYTFLHHPSPPPPAGSATTATGKIRISSIEALCKHPLLFDNFCQILIHNAEASTFP